MSGAEYARRISMYSLIAVVFLVGWLSSDIFVGVSSFDIEHPLSSIVNAPEQKSPSDHVSKDQIHVYENRVVIDLEGAQWAEFTDTNSMDPLLDSESNSLEIKPKIESDVHVGDIISYKPESYDGFIVHRVIKISEDEDGWYATVKGDNLHAPDSEKVRFLQIHGVLVGIIY